MRVRRVSQVGVLVGRGRGRGRGYGKLAFAVVLFFALALGAGAAFAQAAPVRIGTTTTLDRSGLFATLLPAFAKASGRGVRVVGRGPAKAAALARGGEVDVLLLPESAGAGADGADALFAEGTAKSRVAVFATRFVIAGPAEDPAAVGRAPTPVEAIARISRFRAPFVRRLDDSDVRERESALFRAAGLDPAERWATMVETTDGAEAALEIAGQKKAYVVADLAALIAVRERTRLVSLAREGEALRQTYSVLRLDPSRIGHPIESAGAEALERFLRSPEAQALIRDFRVAGQGDPVFTPID